MKIKQLNSTNLLFISVRNIFKHLLIFKLKNNSNNTAVKDLINFCDKSINEKSIKIKNHHNLLYRTIYDKQMRRKLAN